MPDNASTSHPFATLAAEVPPRSPLRAAVTHATRRAEAQCVRELVGAARLAPAEAAAAHALATDLAARLRARGGNEGLVQGLIQEFALSSQEGVALMCLAEALLRIPDAATRDALIRDKIGDGDWHAHVGQSPSLFVNAATWGLLLTGKLVATHTEGGLAGALARVLAQRRRAADPQRRRPRDATDGRAVRHRRDDRRGARQRTQARSAGVSLFVRHARRSRADRGRRAALPRRVRARRSTRSAPPRTDAAFIAGPGISIKLSALHPRYSRAQRARVMGELYPRLAALARRARRHDIGLNIDAEEADRLELSLDLLERLCREPGLAGWNGIGFVVQAYQKRCPAVIDCARSTSRSARRRRLMVRLVKGAYWDSEIKRAQVDGLAGYPVYTRKVHTDVSYLACARKLLAAPAAVYPAVRDAQRAHARGDPRSSPGRISTRANTSSSACTAWAKRCTSSVVAPIAMAGSAGRAASMRRSARTRRCSPISCAGCSRMAPTPRSSTASPMCASRSTSSSRIRWKSSSAMPGESGELGAPHPRIPLPCATFRPERVNSAGVDLADEHRLAALATALLAERDAGIAAAPRVDGRERLPATARDVRQSGRSSRRRRQRARCDVARCRATRSPSPRPAR